MQSFQWDDHFETGIEEVDEQHQYLVKLVNKYSELTVINDFSLDEVKQALDELAEYTVYHFQTEERLMKQVGISATHYEEHCLAHKRFVQDVTEFADAIVESESGDLSKQLLDFLMQWLVYHILGSDQNMARQIGAIKNGVDSGRAFETEKRKHDDAIGPLLHALKALFEQVSSRNKELILLNQSLEEKVKLRTEELSQVNKKLHELSYSDALTNLPNRRFAMKEIAKQWNKARQTGTALVCMLIDADHFKEVNDNSGHDAGDDVLMTLAKTLQHSLPNGNTVCRLGGDEFLVIAPSVDLGQGMELAGHMHHEVNQLALWYGDYCWKGSISVGVAVLSDEMKEVEELIKLADESVYLAKSNGKNRIEAVQLANE